MPITCSTSVRPRQLTRAWAAEAIRKVRDRTRGSLQSSPRHGLYLRAPAAPFFRVRRPTNNCAHSYPSMAARRGRLHRFCFASTRPPPTPPPARWSRVQPRSSAPANGRVTFATTTRAPRSPRFAALLRGFASAAATIRAINERSERPFQAACLRSEPPLESASPPLRSARAHGSAARRIFARRAHAPLAIEQTSSTCDLRPTQLPCFDANRRDDRGLGDKVNAGSWI